MMAPVDAPLLNYAKPTTVQRPAGLLRLAVFVVAAAWLTQLPVVLRPTTTAPAELWILAALPLFAVCLAAWLRDFRGARWWIVATALITLAATLLPIGVIWEDVRLSFDTSTEFGRSMLLLQLGVLFPPTTLLLLVCCLLVAALTCRWQHTHGLLRVSLVLVMTPALVLATVGLRHFRLTEEPRFATYTFAESLLLPPAMVLFLLLPRHRWTIAILVTVLATQAIDVTLLFARAGDLGGIEARTLSHLLGVPLLQMAPALAMLFDPRKSNERP